jgi:hypothetical protein
MDISGIDDLINKFIFFSRDALFHTEAMKVKLI